MGQDTKESTKALKKESDPPKPPRQRKRIETVKNAVKKTAKEIQDTTKDANPLKNVKDTKDKTASLKDTPALPRQQKRSVTSATSLVNKSVENEAPAVIDSKDSSPRPSKRAARNDDVLEEASRPRKRLMINPLSTSPAVRTPVDNIKVVNHIKNSSPQPPKKLDEASGESTRPRKRPTAGTLRIAQQARLNMTAPFIPSIIPSVPANIPTPRAGTEFVAQHYNNVPQHDPRWRKSKSQIKGLRSYNNWVKSVLMHLIMKNAEPNARVLDIGCGKGGDLSKWINQNPRIAHYVGLDPAAVSIRQARERYMECIARGNIFSADFEVKDCFGESLEKVPAVKRVGFDPTLDVRWSNAGFDIVSMMFCMHYAFESEEKARRMLKNVAGALKKGGRLLGVMPNSDVLSAKVIEFHKRKQQKAATSDDAFSGREDTEANETKDDDDDGWDLEKPMIADRAKPQADKGEEKEEEEETPPEQLKWGNSKYSVKFACKIPKDGIFRPPWGWEYTYWMPESVGEVPEFVVPWEGLRALAEDYNLELQFRYPFKDMWKMFKDDPEMGPLSERMNVRDRNGNFLVNDEEMEAASFYHCFSFYKV